MIRHTGGLYDHNSLLLLWTGRRSWQESLVQCRKASDISIFKFPPRLIWGELRAGIHLRIYF